MSLPTYPNGDLDDLRLISSTAGTFWTEQFGDRDLIRALFQGLLLGYDQVRTNYLEAKDALSRHTIRPYHRVVWKKLFFREADEDADAAVARYGEDRSYGQSGLFYGVGAPSDRTYYPVDEPGLTRINFLQNRITAPSLLWVGGIDFEYDAPNRRLVLPASLFADPAVPFRETQLSNGQIVREAYLWAHLLDYDENLPYRQFGYAMRLREPTSQAYVNLLNALADQHVRGPTVGGLRSLLAASAGLPLVEADERVELILTEPQLQICTATKVYSYGAGAVPSVEVGQTVQTGDVPVRGFDLWDLSNGLPAGLSDQMLGLNLDASFLGPGLRSSLFFANRSVPLLSWQSGGLTRISFDVGGWAEDVTGWWERIRQQEDQTGVTLASLLARRADPTAPISEPIRWQRLPRTVNPLRLVLDLMRAHLVVARISTKLIRPDAPGLSGLRSLRGASTPHSCCIIIVDVEIEEKVQMSVDIELEMGQALSSTEEQGSPISETAVWFRQGAV